MMRIISLPQWWNGSDEDSNNGNDNNDYDGGIEINSGDSNGLTMVTLMVTRVLMAMEMKLTRWSLPIPRLQRKSSSRQLLVIELNI